MRWIVSNTLENKQGDTTEFTLSVGDLLYIPKELEHQAFAESKRMSISVPLAEGLGLKPLDRNYYDFS